MRGISPAGSIRINTVIEGPSSAPARSIRCPRVTGVLPRQALEARADPEPGDLHIRESTGRPPPENASGIASKGRCVLRGPVRSSAAHGAGASYGPVITTATERMVATAMELGDTAVPAALLREIRVHGLADRATIWRGAPELLGSSSAPLGGASRPRAATAPGWRTVGLETFSLGPERALVVAGPVEFDGYGSRGRAGPASKPRGDARRGAPDRSGPQLSATVDDTDLVPAGLA